MSRGGGANYRQALRSRDLRLLLASSTVDATGTWAFTIVLQVYVFDRTHSTFWLAVIPAAKWITASVVEPFGGVIADRYERTRLLTLSATLNTVALTVMTVVVATKAPVWLLPVLSAVVALVAAPVSSAAGALVPDVVTESDLGAANALLAVIDNIVVVVGPAIGGLLLLTGRPAVGVGVDAGSFAVAALLAASLRVRSTGAGAQGTGMVAELRAGIHAVRRPTAVLVALVTLDSAVYGAASVLYVPLSRHLGSGSNGASYLLAAAALGGVLAATLAERLSRSPRLAVIIVVSLILQAAPFALTALTRTPAVAAALQVVSGVGMIVVDVIGLTALQRDTPREYLSRVLALMWTAVTLGTVVASFLSALLYSTVGLDATLVVIGLGFSAAGALTLPVLVRGDRVAAAGVAALAPTVDLVAALDLFTGMTRTGLESLVRGAPIRMLDEGEVLIPEGDPADALYVLLSGRCHVVTAAQGVRPDVPAPGYVGEVGLLRGIPRTATVTAAEPSSVLVVDSAAFVAAAEITPPSRSMLETAGLRAA